MVELAASSARNHMEDTPALFKRGVNLYPHGSFVRSDADSKKEMSL